MSYLLPKLTNKSEVDEAIKSTEDLVLVLRFGRDDDNVCMQLDHIVSMKILMSLVFVTLLSVSLYAGSYSYPLTKHESGLSGFDT